MTGFYLQLPAIFFKFWFFEATREQIVFFGSLNRAFLQLFSLPLLVKTYFQPWKNEYREGLVGFSIGMGIFIKSIVIIADIVLLLLLFLFEVVAVLLWIAFPIGTVLWIIL